MVDEQFGPCLEVRAFVRERSKCFRGDETTFQLISFANFDGVAKACDLNHAHVYRSNGIGVIVQNADATNLVLRVYDELFLELAARASIDRITVRVLRARIGIDRVHVPTDSDRKLVVQAGFAAAWESSRDEHVLVHRLAAD